MPHTQNGRIGFPPLVTWVCAERSEDSKQAAAAASGAASYNPLGAPSLGAMESGKKADEQTKQYNERLELIRSDGVLAYTQLQVSWIGTGMSISPAFLFCLFSHVV